MVVGSPENSAHFFLSSGHDLLSVDVGRYTGVDLFRSTVASLADRSSGDQAEHVQVGNESGNSALSQRVLADVFAHLPVDVVHLAGLYVAKTVAFVDDDGGQHQFLLAW